MISQNALAREWGCSQQNVGRLVKRGMPLTSLQAAEEWRAANGRITNGTAAIVDAQNRRKQPPTAAAAPAPAPAAGTAAPAPRPSDPLAALRLAEDEARRDWEASKTDGSLAQTRLLLSKEWLAIKEQLRKEEIAAPAIRKANDRTVEVVAVETFSARVFGFLRARVKAMVGRLPGKLSGASNEDQLEEILEAETDAVIRGFDKECRTTAQAMIPGWVPPIYGEEEPAARPPLIDHDDEAIWADVERTKSAAWKLAGKEDEDGFFRLPEDERKAYIDQAYAALHPEQPIIPVRTGG
ncbi:MAG TPA: hypothetical protein VGO11_19715 [Chthoniobacteraceae bacterium]|jgi:hypothetical protein|nr:hypothetical protein [Chthoniobacteraceae bacterium]